MQLAESIVGLGKFFELFECILQVLLGSQWFAQHLHSSAQIEVEVGVAALLFPGMHEASLGLFQALAIGQLLFGMGGGVEQGLAQVIVAPELQWLEGYGLPLRLEIFLQVTMAFALVGSGQSFFPVVQPLSLLEVAVDGVDEGGQAQFLGHSVDGERLVERLAVLEFGEFQRQQVGLDLQQQAAQQRRKAGQLRPEPADPAHGLVNLQGVERGLHSTGAEQQVALKTGQKLMPGAGLFQLYCLLQGVIPGFQLAQGNGAIQVLHRRGSSLFQGGQCLLGLLGFQLEQGDLIEPAVVLNGFL